MSKLNEQNTDDENSVPSKQGGNMTLSTTSKCPSVGQDGYSGRWRSESPTDYVSDNNDNEQPVVSRKP